MQPDSGKSISLPDIQIYAAGLMVWHLLLNSTSSWIPMKIDGLASIIKFNFQLDPYEKDILFLFCGRRSDRIKGLVWEGDGFLLLYKRLELGGFSWPRTKEEALEITPEQYQALMKGLEIISRHPIQEVYPQDLL